MFEKWALKRWRCSGRSAPIVRRCLKTIDGRAKRAWEQQAHYSRQYHFASFDQAMTGENR
jgi:hypothetical protein